MSDNKPVSSCPKCGWSAQSEGPNHSAQTLDLALSPRTQNLQHSAPTLALVVWSPTEAPTETPTKAHTKGSVFMDKVQELIPELQTAKRKYDSDNRVWMDANRQDPPNSRYTASTWAQRTISVADFEERSIVLAASLSWLAEEGVELKDVQGFMSENSIDLPTQMEVNKLWRQMEGKKAKTKKL